MIFKKRKTAAPPISDEREYIAWFIEHSDGVAHLRDLYKKSREEFIAIHTNGSIRMLRDYPGKNELFIRIGDLSVAYEKQIRPLVESRGGLRRCPHELEATAVSLLMSIYIGIEILEKKYNTKL